MGTGLNDDEAMLVATVREFVDKEVRPTVRDVEHANEYPEAWIEQMKRIGIYGLAVPEEYGGWMRASGRCRGQPSTVLNDAQPIDTTEIRHVSGDDGDAQSQARATDPEVVGADQFATTT